MENSFFAQYYQWQMYYFFRKLTKIFFQYNMRVVLMLCFYFANNQEQRPFDFKIDLIEFSGYIDGLRHISVSY